MNIAMMTSWNSPCGIAKYSEKLVNALESEFCFRTNGDRVNVFIFANSIEPARKVIPKTFVIKWWNEGNAYVDIPLINKSIKKYNIDLLHVQFQQTFFTMAELEKLINEVPIPVVVTYHDSCSFPLMHLPKIHDMGIVQRQEMIDPEMIDHYAPAVWWPHPYEYFRPKVFTHGLGRNDAALIARVCADLDIDFECHDSKVNGWLSEQELQKKMKESDAIVCWYSDMNPIAEHGWYRVPVAGSGAVRTALSSYRPVFINDCKWFGDMSDKCIHRVSTEAELKFEIEKVLNLKEIREHSYQNFAIKHQKLYQDILT